MIDSYNYAFLDEGSKREIRRSILKAVAIPGYQVPFASRELPIGRGWGTGGIQLTLSLIGPDDTLKVIDQGSDESVNAVNIKKFVKMCTNVPCTTRTQDATIVQTRHRVPEVPMRNDQILVFAGTHSRTAAYCGTQRRSNKTDACRTGLCAHLAPVVRKSGEIRQSYHQYRISLYGGRPLHHESQPHPQV